MKFINNSFQILKIVIVILIVTFALPNAFADWTAPLTTPPSCPAGDPGCDAPVNVGTVAQIKDGDLTVDAFSALLNSYFAGKLGIGVIPTLSSPALEVAGQVKITGGSPGAGKVLTSDATGLATWATPTGGPGGGIVDGENVGAGQNVYKSKSPDNTKLQFKRLTAGAGIAINNSADNTTLTISTTGGGGGGGGVTSVSGSLGIIANPTTGPVTLSADKTYLQRRLQSSCTGANQAIGAVDENGNVTCQTISGGGGGGSVSLTGGSGIVVSPNPITGTGSITADSTIQRKLNNSCIAGQFLRGFSQTGAPECFDDQVGTTGGGITTITTTVNGLTINQNGNTVTINPTTNFFQQKITGTCPLGYYMRGVKLDTDGITNVPDCIIDSSYGSNIGLTTNSGEVYKNNSTASLNFRRIQGGTGISVSTSGDNVVIASTGSTGGGDITSVNTTVGSGITGGATSGDVTLNIDTSILQKRVGNSCANGAMWSIGVDGTAGCRTQEHLCTLIGGSWNTSTLTCMPPVQTMCSSLGGLWNSTTGKCDFSSTSSGLGIGQTWQVKTGQALNTPFQNTSSKPIMVSIHLGDGSVVSVNATTNNANWIPLNEASSDRGPISFIVPPGHYYRYVDNTLPPVWLELK